ncbi:MAG: type II secretion system F family protein [Planctomycetales bacterium]
MFSAWTFSLTAAGETPLILKNLQVPLQTGKPLSVGIETLTIHHPFSFMRQKMLHVLDDLMDGVSCWESLRRFRLITEAEFGLLETAERGHSLEWMLGELARSQERRANRRWDALGMLLQPCLVALLGFVVCWIALAFFYPLILILQNLV